MSAECHPAPPSTPNRLCTANRLFGVRLAIMNWTHAWEKLFMHLSHPLPLTVLLIPATRSGFAWGCYQTWIVILLWSRLVVILGKEFVSITSVARFLLNVWVIRQYLYSHQTAISATVGIQQPCVKSHQVNMFVWYQIEMSYIIVFFFFRLQFKNI